MSSSTKTKKRVALLCGGTSGERSISLASGQGALKALVASGHDVTIIDPADLSDLATLINEPFDVAFLATHGKGGEDGALQGFLETLGIPYTGSGVLSSALAMDKAKAKHFYERAGLKTPLSITVDKDTDISGADIVAKLGEDCVVKPMKEGSSLGVFLIKGADEIEEAVKKALLIDDEVLIETRIFGRELTVGVLGNDDPEAFPVIEIVPINEFYDFDSKYLPGGSQHTCPALIDDEMADKLQKQAIIAHQVLGCSGFSRSDFILDDAYGAWILETNTLPGMTKTSLVPEAARAAGIGFPEFCDRLIDFALEKARCDATQA